jgi:hypothetical protein
MTNFYKTLARLVLALSFLSVTFTTLAGTFTVTNTNSSGPGSLSDAITSANGSPGADLINFAIPSGPFVISLTAPLPTITEQVTIDGYSQTGAVAGSIDSRTIIINIDGSGMGSGDILTVNASSVVITGLAIYKSPGYGINVMNGANDVLIQGNFIGTNSTGTTAALGNTTGGIVSNFGNFTATTDLTIGTDGDGTNDDQEGNLIVSTTGSGSGNDGDGILLWETTNSTVAGNIIGLDRNGSNTGMGNARDGVVLTVNSTGCRIGTDGNGVDDNIELNLISANTRNGIQIAATSDGCVITANYIGLDASLNGAGNGGDGIQIINSSNIRIGTNGDGASDDVEANTISANCGNGISIDTQFFFSFTGNSNGSVIAGNFIGTDNSLTNVVGNAAAGIVLSASQSSFNTNNNIIGSNFDGSGDAAEGNTIANNNSGIILNTAVAGSTITGNRISRNSIFNNTTLGIDLSNDGVTSNDDGDADAGANDLLNAPVVTSVSVDFSNNLTIQGFSRPNSIIEFYVADAGPHPNPLPGGFTKSFGQGQTFLFRGQDDGTLDATDAAVGTTGTYDGNDEGDGVGGTRTEAKFSFTIAAGSLPIAVNGGSRIVALAYDNATGAANTSEFGGVMSAVLTPVNLITFTGRLTNSKVYLDWTTAQEFNNSHFDIEKSIDGKNYTKIGTVNGKGGVSSSYSFIDANVTSSINFYRLKQVDIDSRSSLYSKVLLMRGDLGRTPIRVSPSPFTGFFNLSYQLQKEETINIRLFNQIGQLVKTQIVHGSAGINTVNISDLERLAPGAYTLEVKGDSISFRQQLMKQ